MNINKYLLSLALLVLVGWTFFSMESYFHAVLADLTGANITYLIKDLNNDTIIKHDESVIAFYGFVVFINSSGGLEPAYRIRVSVCGVRFFWSKVLNYTYTDWSGFFIVNVHADYLMKYNGFYLSFSLDTDVAKIYGDFGIIVSTRLSKFAKIDEPGAYSLYVHANRYSYILSSGASFVKLESGLVVYYVLGGIFSRACVVHNYLVMANFFMRDVTGVNPPSVSVSMDRGNPATYFDVVGRVIYVSGDLQAHDWVDFSIIVHEYAHFLHITYSQPPPYVKENHAWDEHTDPVTAWVEGFADFFQAVVKDYYGMRHADRYVDTYGQAWIINDSLENHHVSQYNIDFSDVEEAVAAFLWDLYDDENDSGIGLAGDFISLGFKPIWEVMITYDPDPGDPEHERPWTVREFIMGLIHAYSREDEFDLYLLKLLMQDHGILWNGDEEALEEIVSANRVLISRLKLIHFGYVILPRILLVLIPIVIATRVLMRLLRRRGKHWVYEIRE